MDEPCSYEDFRACLVDLEQVNRLSLGYRPTLAWLEGVARTGKTLRVVDVGSGGGEMLRRIAAGGRRRGMRLELIGVDLNPYAARAAREFDAGRSPGDAGVLRRWLRMTAKNEQRRVQDLGQESGRREQDLPQESGFGGLVSGSGIEWVTGDAFSLGAAEGVDVVISSLFTHHLPEAEVVRFLAWMERTARRGWFINDLCREAVPYYAFGALAKAAGWHRFVQHDGPVSFRRSFREDDWRRMLAAAGIAAESVTLRRWTPGRLCAGRLK